MSSIFAILLKEHPKLGQVIYPYFIKPKEIENYAVVERITEHNLYKYNSLLSNDQIELVKEIEEYSDQNLRFRFSKDKKAAVHTFIQNLKPDYFKKHVRPFIDRQMSKAYHLILKNDIPIFNYTIRNVVYKDEQLFPQKNKAEVVFNFLKKKIKPFTSRPFFMIME